MSDSSDFLGDIIVDLATRKYASRERFAGGALVCRPLLRDATTALPRGADWSSSTIDGADGNPDLPYVC